MAFIESPRFPDNIALGAEGGPQHLTDIVEVLSGFEQRNVTWSVPRHRFSVTLLNRDVEELRELAVFMRIVSGRANGFRFKDFFDFEVSITEGLLGTGIGTGEPTYDMVRRYTLETHTVDRRINKPVRETTSVERAGYPLVEGGSPLNAGEYELDSVNGTVSFQADASSNVTQVVSGTSVTEVQLVASIGLVVGEKLWLQDLNGTVGTVLNNAAWTITSIPSGPGNVYAILADTAGLSWTNSGSGRKYPQASETLRWSGEFDVPCRFESDRMAAAITVGGQPDARRGTVDNIELIEIRIP